MTPQRPTDIHNVVDLVEELVDAGTGQAHGSSCLPHAGHGAVDSQPVLRQAGDLPGGVDLNLRQERVDKCVKDFLFGGHARGLQSLTNPRLNLVDQNGNDSQDQVFLHAHVGDHRMHSMEHLQDGPHAFFAMRLQRADFSQRHRRVRIQRGVPHNAGHVLQAGGEPAKGFFPQTVTDHAAAPLAPDDLRNGGRIELTGGVRRFRGCSVAPRQWRCFHRSVRRACTRYPRE